MLGKIKPAPAAVPKLAPPGAAGASLRVKEAARVETVSWENKVLKGGVRVLDVLLGSPAEADVSLVQAVEKTKAAYGKDLILFIGPTGAGKSTTIDYLLGHELEEQVNDEGETTLRVNEKVTTKYAKMGNTLESCTVYPESFSAADSDLCYCDCPGFFDTRPKPRIITNMSIDMVAKSARKIQGIVLLVEDAALFGQKAAGFRELLVTLQRLIKDLNKKSAKDFELLKASMTVVYNPKDKKRNETNINIRLGKLIDSEKSKFEALQARLQAGERSEEISLAYNESAANLSMMRLIQELLAKGRFVIMSPLDAGESRERIIGCLRASGGIPKDMLSFSDMDPAQQRMNQVMLDIAGEANLLLMNQKLAQDEMKKLEARFPELENELVRLRKQLGLASAKGSAFLENLERNRRETLSSLEANQKLKEDKEKEAKALKAEVDKLKRELQEIDNAELVQCFRLNHLVEKQDKVARVAAGLASVAIVLPVFLLALAVDSKAADKKLEAYGEYVFTKTVEYSGRPFTEVRYSEGLVGSVVECDKARGEFTYKIDVTESSVGLHSISFYTEKRLLPGNQQHIAVLRKALGIDKDGRVIGAVQDKVLRQAPETRVVMVGEDGKESQGGKLNQLQRLIAEIADLNRSIAQAQKYITDITSDSATMEAATERRKGELEEQIGRVEAEKANIRNCLIPGKHEILAENEAKFAKNLQLYKVVQYIVMALCLDTDPDPQYQKVIPEFLAGLAKKGIHPEFSPEAPVGLAPAAGGAGSSHAVAAATGASRAQAGFYEARKAGEVDWAGDPTFSF